MKQERAMTLIELMLAVAIAVTLTSLALPSYIEFVKKSRRAEQAVLIPYFEKNVKLRLQDESMALGTYTAGWSEERVRRGGRWQPSPWVSNRRDRRGPTDLYCHRARGPQWADGLAHARLATVLGVGAAQ